MGKQSFPSKAKRGNAGHLAALARGKVPGESDKKKKLKHGGVGGETQINKNHSNHGQ